MSEKIKFKGPIFCDGAKYAIFIENEIEIHGSYAIGIVWALTGADRATHTLLFQTAVEYGYLDETNEPIGGGTVRLNTLEIVPSIRFHEASYDSQAAFIRMLQHKNYRGSCD